MVENFSCHYDTQQDAHHEDNTANTVFTFIFSFHKYIYLILLLILKVSQNLLFCTK
jgi:hypothetical protein